MADKLIDATKDKEFAKFREKFQIEKIRNLTENDFRDFLKACPKLFATRRGNPGKHEYRHGGQVASTFPQLKKALEIIVDESRPLHERLEEINSDAVKFKRKNHFKSAIFSPILWIINPKKYAIFNRTVEIMLKEKYHEEFHSNEWQTYERANKKLKDLAKEKGCSLYELDQEIGEEYGKKPAENESPAFQKMKERIEGIQDQANYQYVMMRFLLGKKSTTIAKIIEEFKRWNSDKPQNYNYKNSGVFDTKIFEECTERTNNAFTLTDYDSLNFSERHQLIALCEEKIKDRIKTENEGTVPYSDLVFSPLTDKQEIKKAHDKVISKLIDASDRVQEFKINPLRGYFKDKVYWIGKHNVCFWTSKAGKIGNQRYWDVFSTEEPRWQNSTLQSRMIVEINPPIEGKPWRTEGQLLKDNYGKIYCSHTGSIAGKGGDEFSYIYAGLALKINSYSDNKKRAPRIIISDIDSPNFVEDVTDYVKEVSSYRHFVENPKNGAEEPTDYWMIRAGDKGKNWEEQRDMGIIGIHYHSIDLSKCTEKDDSEKLSKEKTRKEVDRLCIKEGNEKLSDHQWDADFGQLRKFFSVNRKEGKCRIVAIGGNKELFGIGDATGQYKYQDELEHPHTIAVKWFNTQEREIPNDWKGISGHNRTIKKLKKDDYDSLMSGKAQSNPKLCEKFEKMGYTKLLEKEKQIIFYGPPGTGKTWTAENFAKCRAQKKKCKIKMVIFHPSYSYEDFVEGFRPAENNIAALLANQMYNKIELPEELTGDHKNEIQKLINIYKREWKNQAFQGRPQFNNLSQYVLESGTFKTMCEAAKDDEKTDYILIIDEINRGNISKIFGELILLIENDKRGSEHVATLPYSRDTFFVPKNLYIIGTMNTADMSLVQVDTALRRRFGFIELMPDVSSEIKFKNEKYKTYLKNLNEKIRSRKNMRDKQVGHSYFMNLKNDGELQFSFKHKIIPLLQDYFYYDYKILAEILGEYIIDKKEQQINEKCFKDNADSRNLFVEKLEKALSKKLDSDNDND